MLDFYNAGTKKTTPKQKRLEKPRFSNLFLGIIKDIKLLLQWHILSFKLL